MTTFQDSKHIALIITYKSHNGLSGSKNKMTAPILLFHFQQHSTPSNKTHYDTVKGCLLLKHIICL